MMFSKLSRSSKIKRILVVSLSNIGDVILTLPVVDILRASFPDAKLHLIVGPKALSLFHDNPCFEQVIVYEKKMPWRGKLAWFWALRRMHFDLVVDLRHSMLPFLLDAGTATRSLGAPPKVHMKAKHLACLAQVFDDIQTPVKRSGVVLSEQQQLRVDRFVQGWHDYVVVAPGAADPRKRWSEQGFLQVVRHLRHENRKVILVGDRMDRDISARIRTDFAAGVIDLCGETTLVELAGVIARAELAVTNDSGIMHLASYFDRPVIALFGRTDPFFYGPWSSRCVALRKGVVMGDIKAEHVIAEVDKFLC